MTNNTLASHIVEDDDAALGIDRTAFDEAAMDLLFEDFADLDDPFGEPLAEEDRIYGLDPTGGSPSAY